MLYWLPIDHHLIINWVTSIIRAIVQGSAVFIVVWIILRLFPKIHPVTRCWLWRIVYLKFLVSLWGGGTFQLPWLFLQKILPLSIFQALCAYTRTKWLPTIQNLSQWVPTTQVSQWVPANRDLSTINPYISLVDFFEFKWWFLLWVLGVGLFALGMVLLWYLSRKSCKDNRPVRDPALEKLYREFCDQLNIHKPPKLYQSNTLNSPLLYGIIQPRIVIPATVLTQYKPEEIKLILAHELAHFKRYDLVWNWVVAITQGLFFFHPLVWLAAYQAKESQEICADALAVQFTGARSLNYGKVLVKATVQSRIDQTPGLSPMQVYQCFAVKSKQLLFKRLMALEKPRLVNHRWIWISVTVLIGFGLAVLIPWQLFPAIIYW